MAESKVGVLGGTFDPIHLGHLIIAEHVREKLSLAKVLFVPAGKPWLKEGSAIAAGQHRLEMVRLATASNPRFEVSTLDLERPGPTYSVDTVADLQSQLGPGTRLYFLVGMDALAGLPSWKEPRRLVERCQMVAVRRPGHEQLDWRALEAVVPGARKRIQVVDAPLIDISATDIRERVARGLSIRYLVPELVERYIAQHRLYL